MSRILAAGRAIWQHQHKESQTLSNQQCLVGTGQHEAGHTGWEFAEHSREGEGGRALMLQP